MDILVTGGAGYIGSHTVLALLESGHRVRVLDNYSNSSPESLRRVQQLTGKSVDVREGDVRDLQVLRDAMTGVQGIIHFAALKAVGESVDLPLQYYRNNLDSTLSVLELLDPMGVDRFVFSSSATVYGDPEVVPVTEESPLSATNPYGRTKLFSEEIIRDVSRNSRAKSTILRYFNPVGAHESGAIGEDPSGTPNNLMPYVAQVAIGRRPHLNVFGSDYPTVDGTGVRDYIHVMDLAEAHVAALVAAQDENCTVYNLGTGSGYSVLQLVEAYARAAGRPIPYEIKGRRAGDVAAVWADPTLAADRLNWRAHRTIENMCIDSWNWQSKNPNGFKVSDR